MSNESSAQAVNQQEPTTIWNKTFISLFLTSMAFNLGLFMSNSLMSVYAKSMGASETEIGLVISTFAFSSILFRLISAPIMDTYNRKFVVIFATLTLSTAFFGFSMSQNIGSLMAFRLVQGCGMAFGNACCLAMVSEVLPKDKYSSGIGYYSLAQVMCQALGPSLGLAMVDWVGFNMTYAINASVMLIAAFLASRIKLNFKRTKKLKLVFNNIIAKEAILPASIMFLLSTGATTVTSFLIIFARDYQGITSNIGLFFTVSALSMLVTRPIVGKLTDRFGIVKVLIPAFSCNIISFIIISYSTTLTGFLIAALVSAFGQGACQPAMQALSLKAVSTDRRGAASSTNYIGMDSGNLVGPTVAGAVAQMMGYNAMWRVMVIPFVIGMLIVFLFKNKIVSIEESFVAG